MVVLAWMLAGLIVGAVARLVLPGRDPGGLLVTELLAVAGAMLGGSLARGLGLTYFPHLPGIGLAIVGAVVLVVGYRMAIADGSV